ncbi:MAG: radical SAM family heme chaperone HemW [Candidatus Marinimicrobia bacterium]|nr:radical SAM family heme chaperone HemW [Candidatus Neomarinimicrobiota bacterium]
MPDSDYLSIYIHFPFCVRKCLYCDFASEDWGLERIDKWTDALILEINLNKEKFISSPKLYTLYIGGGSPNLVGVDNFYRIVKTLNDYFDFDTLREFTVEVNPGGTSIELLNAFKNAGVNRISIGCQSFIDVELKTLGRIHSVDDIVRLLEQVKSVGIPQRNLDLIFGIPGQTIESWKNSLENAILYNVEHLSLYNLIYEEGTPLSDLRSKGIISPLEEEQEWLMYDLAHKMLEKAGFIHYEISNWAKPDYMAVHNSIYWSGGKYLGFGPSAHSFDGENRWWNCRDVDTYINFLKNDELPITGSEKLSVENKKTEYFLLGLRTQTGIEISRFESVTGMEFIDAHKMLIGHLGEKIEGEYGYIDGNYFRLTHRGWFLCDYITGKLLTLIEERKP